MWAAVTVLIIVFFATGGVGALLRVVEGRRKFQLELRQEERRIAEAKARELEIQYKRAELEYREALLELERFDRRTGIPRPPPDPIEKIDKIEEEDG